MENASMDDIVKAASIANAHDFILKKENGYETNIGDRGAKLSGGERQRMTIARAVLKNPPILILDEATSSIDPESEAIIQEATSRLLAQRTVIVIAHRLSTVRRCDQILVMNQGQVVERGTHEDLYASGGYYRQLAETTLVVADSSAH